MTKIKFIVIILILAIISLGLYYYQKNIYSKETLKLEILGPSEASLLEEVEYVVKYKYTGDTRLEEPELIFEFPEDSIPLDADGKRSIKGTDDFDDKVIYPGQEKTFTFKARLLGKEGDVNQAKATISYRPKNLKPRYSVDTTLTTVIQKAPLTFEFDLPSNVDPGDDFFLRLNYFSNIDYPLSDLRVIMDYPSNFEYISATPKSLEKNEWEIGLLNKAEGGRIEVLGRLTSAVGDQEIFEAKLGMWKDGEFIVLKEVAKGVEVVKPDIRIRQYINNNPEYVASPGDSLHYEIYFRNIGEKTLNNLFLVCELEGGAFDFNTIKSSQGEFESGDNSIIFDWRRVSDLRLLSGQKEGKVEFWINLKEGWDFSADTQHPTLKTKVLLSQVRQDFVNKVNSRVEIDQKGYYADEVFGNTGPTPPEVGEPTTYTITWSAKNYYSEIRNARVKAVLPSQVRLTGEMFPEKEEDKLSFDSQSREIVWELGDLNIGEGILSSPPSVSFQISFTPDAIQRGRIATLIGEARLSGQDQWTEDIVEVVDEKIETDLPDDPNVGEEGGIVK